MQKHRRGKQEGAKQVPWLLTYSDMVTLCLTFFVLLYSFSTLDAIKWKSVVISVQGALGPLDGGKNLIDGPPGNDPEGVMEQEEQVQDLSRMDEFLRYQQDMKKLEEVKGQLADYLEKGSIAPSVILAMEERGLVLRFQDSVLFNKGRAELLPAAVSILENVTGILMNIDNAVRIEGHTDDLPINTPRFPSNWELSTARATNVLRFMIDEGMPGNRLSAVGYGEFRPLVPNSSEENRGKNRRVDIVIIRERLMTNEPR